MIDAAETLLCERGLAGAGIKELVARSGAPIGSVYHFFPGGKTQLVGEALEQHAAKTERLYRQFLADDRAPLGGRIRRLFRGAADGFVRAGGGQSCAVAAVTLDLDKSDTQLRDVCLASFEGWVQSIADHLPWRDASARVSFARMMLIALEGAFILARAEQRGSAFITAGEWLAAFAESLPAPPKANSRRP